MKVTKESCAFGALVKRLRGGWTQASFANRLGVARSAVANAERGRLPGDGFVSKLIDLFPAEKAEIDEWFALAARTSRADSSSGRRSADVENRTQFRRVRSLLRQGRNHEARAVLQRLIATSEDPEERVVAGAALSEAYFGLGRPIEGEQALCEAVATADQAELSTRSTALRNLLAGRCQRSDRHELALSVLDDGLQRSYRDPILWRRRGIILWYAHRYPDAYAALTTALSCGLPRQRVLNARGHVLAEWGHYEDAIAELSEAIETAPTPLSEAYARHGRAFAYGSLGDLARALEEFAEAEHLTFDSGWLHYYRGRCYESANEPNDAAQEYGLALKGQSPRLNEPKRLDVLNRLKLLGSIPAARSLVSAEVVS